MSEPQTDAEKIDWLWAKVERLHGENASLRAALDQEEARTGAERANAERSRASERQMAGELGRMAAELNAARGAAAEAVRDYVELTKER